MLLTGEAIMARPKSLTPDQLANAIGRYKAGETVRDIAASLTAGGTPVSKTGLTRMLNGRIALRPKKTQRSKGVSPEAFVRAWQACDTVAAVAVMLGMSQHLVHQRATNYRKKGINLKKLKDGRGYRIRIDVVALNAIIAETLAPKDPGFEPVTTSMGDI
jgi:hypothetical protein